MFDPPLQIAAWLAAKAGGVWLLGSNGGVFALCGAPFHGTPFGQPYWGDRRAAKLEPFGISGYTVVATTGERYDYGA